MKFFSIIFIALLLLSLTKANATNATNWLKSEIDNILYAYNDDKLSNIEKFNNIETTIDKNFAGAGIAKFVAGKAWATANKESKKTYIKLFKHHLALNIASMMQGYSNQTYSLINTKEDKKNKVILIDMEIQDQTSKLIITWRVKESKGKFYVIDLMVADISLVVTKRSEFNSMLKKIDYNLQSLNEILYKQNETSYNKLIN